MYEIKLISFFILFLRFDIFCKSISKRDDISADRVRIDNKNYYVLVKTFIGYGAKKNKRSEESDDSSLTHGVNYVECEDAGNVYSPCLNDNKENNGKSLLSDNESASERSKTREKRVKRSTLSYKQLYLKKLIDDHIRNRKIRVKREQENTSVDYPVKFDLVEKEGRIREKRIKRNVINAIDIIESYNQVKDSNGKNRNDYENKTEERSLENEKNIYKIQEKCLRTMQREANMRRCSCYANNRDRIQNGHKNVNIIRKKRHTFDYTQDHEVVDHHHHHHHIHEHPVIHHHVQIIHDVHHYDTPRVKETCGGDDPAAIENYEATCGGEYPICGSNHDPISGLYYACDPPECNSLDACLPECQKPSGAGCNLLNACCPESHDHNNCMCNAEFDSHHDCGAGCNSEHNCHNCDCQSHHRCRSECNCDHECDSESNAHHDCAREDDNCHQGCYLDHECGSNCNCNSDCRSGCNACHNNCGSECNNCRGSECNNCHNNCGSECNDCHYSESDGNCRNNCERDYRENHDYNQDCSSKQCCGSESNSEENSSHSHNDCQCDNCDKRTKTKQNVKEKSKEKKKERNNDKSKSKNAR